MAECTPGKLSHERLDNFLSRASAGCPPALREVLPTSKKTTAQTWDCSALCTASSMSKCATLKLVTGDVQFNLKFEEMAWQKLVLLDCESLRSKRSTRHGPNVLARGSPAMFGQASRGQAAQSKPEPAAPCAASSASKCTNVRLATANAQPDQKLEKHGMAEGCPHLLL